MKNARCTHVQHKRAGEPYSTGKDRVIMVPIVLGYNNIQHRYEICDEGFVGQPQNRTKKITRQED